MRQRGDVSSSSLKMGRIICELEKIYGVRQGSAGKAALDSPMAIPKQCWIKKPIYATKN